MYNNIKSLSEKFSIIPNHRLSTERLMKEIQDDFDMIICRQTVRNQLSEIGLHDRISTK